MAFIAPKPKGACAQGLRAINAIHPQPSARVITSLYPEGIDTRKRIGLAMTHTVRHATYQHKNGEKVIWHHSPNKPL